MHLIFLQLNVSQLACLMSALVHFLNDTLILCCKLGKACNMVLKINGHTKEYRNVKISFEQGGYSMENEGGEYLYFTEENVLSVEII